MVLLDCVHASFQMNRDETINPNKRINICYLCFLFFFLFAEQNQAEIMKTNKSKQVQLVRTVQRVILFAANRTSQIVLNVLNVQIQSWKIFTEN